MQCEQARQLFDAYLDGELSPPLAMELGAHRIHCPECRRALALLEVSGHIIASDRDPVDLSSGFSNRLLACMGPPGGRWEQRLRRVMYIGGPLAAAAVVAMAFLGVFDPDAGPVLSRVEQRAVPQEMELPDLLDEQDLPKADDHAERVLDEWIQEARTNIAAKRQSGESLQQMLDLTITQWLDILNQANEVSTSEDHPHGVELTSPPPPPEAAPADSEDVEDL